MVSKQVFTSDKVVVHYKKVHHYIRLQCKEHCVYKIINRLLRETEKPLN